MACLLAAAVFAVCGAGCAPTDPGEEEKRTMTNAPVYDGVAFSETLWTAPAYEADAERDRSEEIRAIWYTTYYKGEGTKAFAYLGIPAGASAENPAPAVLLLHGGAGTAYYEWVEMWVNRGYVALAPDLEGHVPLESGRMSSAPAELYERSAYPAPQNKNYGDAALPLDETWMYYAASTAILGNSLLHSLDMVDRYKIGVCGVSWGGVVTSVVSGYDDRFAFSIPIYCSLNVGEEKGILGDAYRANPAALVWDDDRGLAARETPILFYIANTDSVSACSASSVSETYERCKNARMLIVDGLLHSQYHAATAVETYFFADSIVKNGAAFSAITTEPDQDGTSVVYRGDAAVEATLWYTDAEITQTTPEWSSRRCAVNGTSVAYSVPEGAKYFYIHIDDGGLGISTRVVKL